MNIYDANILYESYLLSVKTSKWKTSSQLFINNYLAEIQSIQDDIINHSYKTGKISQFVIYERGKRREIKSNTVRDRVVRHALNDYFVYPNLKPYLIKENGASQKGKGVEYQRKLLREQLHHYYRHFGNKGYILKIDFHKYYDNIKHSVSYDILKRNLLSYEDEIFREVLSAMGDGEVGGDIGDQTSQNMGISLPIKIDNYIKIVKSQKYYGRYMDDIWIISNSLDTLKELLQGIESIADELGIIINRDKTKICRIDKGFTFMQRRFVLTDTGRLIERMLNKQVTRYRRKQKKLAVKVHNGERDFEIISNNFYSWLKAFHRYMSKRQIDNLIELLVELYREEMKTWRLSKLFLRMATHSTQLKMETIIFQKQR